MTMSISDGTKWLLSKGYSMPLDEILVEERCRLLALEALEDCKMTYSMISAAFNAETRARKSHDEQFAEDLSSKNDTFTQFVLCMVSAFAKCAYRTEDTAVLAGLDADNKEIEKFAFLSLSNSVTNIDDFITFCQKVELLLHAKEGISFIRPCLPKEYVEIPFSAIEEENERLHYPEVEPVFATTPEEFRRCTLAFFDQFFGGYNERSSTHAMLLRKINMMATSIDFKQQEYVVVAYDFRNFFQKSQPIFFPTWKPESHTSPSGAQATYQKSAQDLSTQMKSIIKQFDLQLTSNEK